MSSLPHGYPEARQQIQIHDAKAEALLALANNIGALAMAINRLADTQTKDTISGPKGPVSFSVANFEDQPDGQTEQLRELSRKSREG